MMAYLVKKPDKKQSIKSANTAGLVTFEKFYDIVEENVKADLLDGKIIRDSPAIPRHGETCMWFSTVLTFYVQKFDLGKINGGTTTVRLSTYQGPEPDIFFVRKSRLRIIGEKYLEGPPDLCIEVISKSSRRLHSKVLPGFWLKSDWLAADPLPPVLKTLQEILGEGHRLI